MRTKSTIHSLRLFFLSGQSGTAKELGREYDSQDIRKAISDLRYQGWDIQSIRITDTGIKRYWLNPSTLEEKRKDYCYTSDGSES